MPRLTIAGETRDIDLVVFDKDGTLVDFDQLWAGKLKAAVDAVSSSVNATPTLVASLCATLGIEPEAMKVIPESPLAVSTLPKLMLACAVVLHQHGQPWHAAETIAREVFYPVIQEPPRRADLIPIGDVSGLFNTLAAAGFRIAIFTSDDRHATAVSLPMLGIVDQVGAMVCGDDALPSKPAGDGLVHLAKHFGVPLSRVLMIGDSVTDMRAASAAHVGWRVAVRSGTGDPNALIAAADAVINSIADIGIG